MALIITRIDSIYKYLAKFKLGGLFKYDQHALRPLVNMTVNKQLIVSLNAVLKIFVLVYSCLCLGIDHNS